METDSNHRLYYKLPSHLERHYKRVLAFKTERSTVLMGTNATALKAFHDLLAGSDNTVETLAAQTVPELPAGLKDHCYSEDGEFLQILSIIFILIHCLEFSRLDTDTNPSRHSTNMISSNEPELSIPMQIDNLNALSLPADQCQEQSTEEATTNLPVALAASHTQQLTLDFSRLLVGPSTAGSREPVPCTSKSVRRCALCVSTDCPRRFNCKGSGGRHLCQCKHPSVD